MPRITRPFLFCVTLLSITISALACLSSHGQAAIDKEPLAPFRWEKRVFIIFGNSKHTDMASAQYAAFFPRYESGVHERDMAVITVFNQEKEVTITTQAPLTLRPDDKPSAEALLNRYNIGRAHFYAVLIGKDGTLKGSWAEPVSPEKIFAIIDAMPMRQREMQAQESAP